jgi:hypothetical protein
MVVAKQTVVRRLGAIGFLLKPGVLNHFGVVAVVDSVGKP